ncbi:MAG: hypothetical protein HY718_10015 [Planctomycetes bacterium]|nr:hypothetical protein [Planctomycetota bacterium]
MPTLEYFLVARDFSVDQRTNRVSIFNIMEEIHAREFPITIPNMVILCSWNAENGDNERDFQMTLRPSLDGRPVGIPQPLAHNFRIPGRRCRNFVAVEGLPLAGPGRLLVELLLNGDHVASHTIDVVRDALEE